MPSKNETTQTPAQELQPRDPQARPHYPQRDARAVQPTYIFEDEPSEAMPQTHATAPPAASAVLKTTQPQEPREPEAYPHFPVRP